MESLPVPWLNSGTGQQSPVPALAWGQMGRGMLLMPITPKCFTVHQIPALNIKEQAGCYPPVTKELFLYKACFIYRLTLAFARGMTWALSYHFLLTWNYWVSGIREETQWAESMRKMFLSFPWSTENKQPPPFGRLCMEMSNKSDSNCLFKESQTLSIFHLICVQLLIYIA